MDLSGWTENPRAHMCTVIDVGFSWKANNFMRSWASTVAVKTKLVIRTCRRRQLTEPTQRHLPAGLHGDDKTQRPQSEES